MLNACTEDLVKPSSISRRKLFTGILAVPVAAAPAMASIDPHERVMRDAATLATSMKALCGGGEWSVEVEGTFALIQLVFATQPQ